MKKQLVISDYVTECSDSSVRHSAKLNNDVIWFEIPKAISPPSPGEMFLGAALLEAMVSQQDIIIEAPLTISPLLLTKIHDIQQIYHNWNPKLHPIKIHTDTIENITTNKTTSLKAGSFFSGGVDSTFTLISHLDDIDYLIFLTGFDQFDPADQHQTIIEKLNNIAKKHNKTLVVIKNNIREYINEKKISNEFQHGITMASLGISLPLAKVYIPSSFTYNFLIPWGSHPLVDPMWSSEKTAVFHDGLQASRVDKTLAIIKKEKFHDDLQVCWRYVDHNCGQCSKCIRTLLVFELINKSTNAFPDINIINHLKYLKPNNVVAENFIQELIDLSQKTNNRNIEIKLRRLMWLYLVKFHSHKLAHLLTFNLTKKALDKFSNASWRSYRVRIDWVS
ncbi:hypothetical protein H0A36_09275 [Endozoicomonas sp. SM1973]|uniref:Uncharacterized protein n=1 Tax=Spartinivicinus marinus TaxID=2994442 RepID=A0A853I7Z9_9GAMM|nr:hypothetical protein [Spartinivicinus marinus]MCX4028120.1 hypothetical protein [Spartinivicinus marinus]NYZ66204.1 hypothetical protein [Spartinivicinus marinus]